MTAVAELAAASKAFRGRPALDRVSLRLERGESVALLGPNGAGKTTAIALLLGLRRPDSGEARLFGQPPGDRSARSRIGVTPQVHGFPPGLRVREIVALAAAHHRDPVPEGELLGRFGLTELRRRQAGGLSGGEARRLALALAFVGRPEAVLLDEPTVALDIEARRQAWSEIGAYAARGGTVLLTSHQLDEVEALASRAVVLAAGRVVAEGPIPEIRAAAGLTRIALAREPATVPPGVVRVERGPSGAAYLTGDPERVLRELVQGGAPLAGLEVRPAGLDEAVLALSAAGRP